MENITDKNGNIIWDLDSRFERQREYIKELYDDNGINQKGNRNRRKNTSNHKWRDDKSYKKNRKYQNSRPRGITQEGIKTIGGRMDRPIT